MRARLPDLEGFVERPYGRVAYEVFGQGEPTIFLLPTWQIMHSRHWKAQVPFLAREHMVVTADALGSGRADRPTDPAAYDSESAADDMLAVLDATGVARAVLVGFSAGCQLALMMAARRPDCALGLVLIGNAMPLAPGHPDRAEGASHFNEVLSNHEGWYKTNRAYWQSDFPDYVRFFMGQVFNQPHSTKQYEDAVGCGLETTGQVLAATFDSRGPGKDQVLEMLARLQVPVIAIHGTDDAISPSARTTALAEAIECDLLMLEGSGHAPHGRDPVAVNVAIREFVDRLAPPRRTRTWSRGRSRRKRALYVSSPIGLGHARRDLAIARELRELVPDLEIDWLAQHPVTAVLEAAGERIHPASGLLAGESAHIQSESRGHELHVFQAWRRLDEILIANFMVFLDAVREGGYDLWIGDEAWEVDYYLHENPELKSAAYAWLTDFVGWLPMPEGGEEEARIVADYNAEMIEHIARFPRLRERAIFIGEPEDIVPDRFGLGLPLIRDWTERHYRFSGYVTGFEPPSAKQRARLRSSFGWGDQDRICVVTVGGSGVGSDLLRRVVDAYEPAREQIPALRMVVVAGPRIKGSELQAPAGVEVAGFLPDLNLRLAAADLAVVQGGLTTGMELAAARVPFLYFPLRLHCEQNFHVRYRLERYQAGRAMEFETSPPEAIAAAMAEELKGGSCARPVESDGAARAAAMIAELL
jgi:pimeloyl-ACP methyl ester carboxylesterase/predicted glycosyltransferase